MRFYEITGAHSCARDERVLIAKGTLGQITQATELTGASATRIHQPDSDQYFDYDLDADNPPRETNVEFVTRIMEHGSPLNQAFVITAIEKYAERCIAAGAAKFDNAFLNGEAWVSVAKELKAECDKKAAS